METMTTWRVCFNNVCSSDLNSGIKHVRGSSDFESLIHLAFWTLIRLVVEYLLESNYINSIF